MVRLADHSRAIYLDRVETQVFLNDDVSANDPTCDGDPCKALRKQIEDRGDVKSDADGLEIKGLELRAPGATQLRLSGRVGTMPAGMRFEGSTQVEANDPRALIAWLTERTEQLAAAEAVLVGIVGSASGLVIAAL